MSDARDSLREDAVVWLTTAPNEPEALMWAATLRDAGIAAMLKPGGPGAGAWASSATFSHEIFVHERDFDRAKSLVRALLQGGGAVTRPAARRANAPRVRPVVRTR
ncbi:MAG: DUF2007 domain-containing protein [Thermomicrobiales bacterium]